MITRYEPYLDYPRSYTEPELGMEPYEDGDFVKYEDHIKIVENLSDQIERLKQQAIDNYCENYFDD